MMYRPGAGEPVYAVRAEAVPVTVYAVRMARGDFRIWFARGIGWAPKRYGSAEAVLAALLPLASYGVAEARMAKAICKQDP